MTQNKIATSPKDSTEMPTGIPYIIGNEAAERFSFYGMKAILVVFMTKYLVDSAGYKDLMSPEEAKTWYHLFTSAVYFTPIFGAILSDWLLGKYKTILLLSVVYCLGHLALALDETRMGLTLGLTLIAIGSGGIKPCVSAHVGDQFGARNHHLLEKVFGWFYFAINFGAFLSMIATPYLLQHYGPHVAFGIPGALMLLATIVFWWGRTEFIHVPAGGTSFIKEVFSAEGLKSVGSLFVLYLFVAMFWALFDQTGSSWILQSEKMNLTWLGITWLPSQIQSINSIMVMAFIPLFSFFLYPAINRFYPLSPLRKISIGMFLMVLPFLVTYWVGLQIEAGHQPSIGWHFIAYIWLTVAEIFVSITCLEFSYTQAPKNMKSFVMAFFLLSVSFGNLFVAGVNYFIQESKETKVASVSSTLKVSPQKTTHYALSCATSEKPSWNCNNPLFRWFSTCSDNTHSTTRKVSVVIEKEQVTEKKKEKTIEKKKEKQKEAEQPRILAWQANGKSGSYPATSGEELGLSWKTTLLEHCKINGKAVASVGTLKHKAKQKETLTLVCQTKDGKSKGSKLRILMDQGVRVQEFFANNQTSLSFSKAPASLLLSWKTERASSCTLTSTTSRLSGSLYHLFFAVLMLITALLFMIVAYFYKERSYLPSES